MQFPDIDPFVFGLHWGAIGLRWYALSYVAGILLGWRYAAGLLKNARIWEPRAAPIDGPQLDDVILWITLGIILGGRVGYIVFYGAQQDPPIWAHPLNLFKIWEGGMSFHGGLLGVITAVLMFSAFNTVDGMERLKLSQAQADGGGGLEAWLGRIFAKALRIGDLIAPAAPIGLFFGRIANFVNGELWGRKTDLPWGMVFCNRTIETNYGGACPAGDVTRHPSQLYEAGLEGIVLFLLLRWATHKAQWLPRPGAITGLFLLGYGVARAALENVREPDDFMPAWLKGSLTMGMVLSIPMILIGIWLIWRARRPATAA